MAIQLLLCGVMLPGFVEDSSLACLAHLNWMVCMIGGKRLHCGVLLLGSVQDNR